MNEFLKTLLQIIAALGALATLAKTAFDVLREYQANKATLATLLARRHVRIAVGVILAALAVLIGAVWYVPFTITVQLWDIKMDQKNAIIASQQVRAFGPRPGDELLQRIGRWVTDEIAKKYDLGAGPVQIHVSVPADFRTGKVDVQATPPGPLDVNFWLVDGAKLRAPVDPGALAGLNKDFQIEIGRPGYRAHILRVTWHQAMEARFILRPHEVSIGIEEFSGDDHSLAIWLSNYLAKNPRFAIKDPTTLKALRDRIADESRLIASNPVVQTSIRTTLGLDLIIAGSFNRQ